MDKRTGAGNVRIDRLQFLPMRPISLLNPDSQARLRRGELSPPEAVYVGELPGDDGAEAEETVGLLSEVFYLPVGFFDPEVASFELDERADPNDPWHLVLHDQDTRIATLDEDGRELLQDKMRAYWLHERRPDGP